MTTVPRIQLTGMPAGAIGLEHIVRSDCQPKRVWSPTLVHTITEPVVAGVMGVFGSGKTTVSALLAAALGRQFQEGDDLHPAENVEKMESGTPLTDADRLPRPRMIAAEIDAWRARHESGVLNCSAPKRSYRDIIIDGRSVVTLVYLRGSHDLIHARIAARHGHFMRAAPLDSQFATLQEPMPDEYPIVVDVGRPPAEIVHQLEAWQGSGQCNESVCRNATAPETPIGGRQQ